MVHDFTLVYALDSGMGSQEDVLRQVAGSDCADATVGWGRPGHVGFQQGGERPRCCGQACNGADGTGAARGGTGPGGCRVAAAAI